MLINQSETALDCFHSRGFNTQIASPQQQLILNEMSFSHRASGRFDDFTIGELAKFTGLDKSSVSARRNAMMSAGLVVLSDERKCTVSGKMCQTVKLPVDLVP